MKIIDRGTNCIIEERPSAIMKFLYNTFIGRFLLKLITLPVFSKILSLFLNSRISSLFINNFVKRHHINMTKCVQKKYKSFNDFFKRSYTFSYKEINENVFISGVNGKVSCFTISKNLVLSIKHSKYSISDLLKDDNLAKEYANGLCLVFRLTPDDYHRYVFFDSGKILSFKKIKGILHSVKPIAHSKFSVFTQNSREISVLETEHFGSVVQIEIGALVVGKINNHLTIPLSNFKKFDEKGFFEFGGSTICLLLKPNVVSIDSDIWTNSLNNIETRVHIGEKIGTKIE